jgi:CRP-like cAMP-binding protein
VRATDIAVVLVIDGEELRTLLSESTDLVEGVFRTLLTRGAPALPSPTLGERVDVLEPLDSRPLSLLDTSFILHQAPVLSALSADEAVQLAGIARDIVADAGDVLATEADPAALSILLSGEIVLEPPAGEDAPVVLRAGDVVGLLEVLAGLPLGRRQRAARRTRALRIEREDLFDLLGQRPALLQQLLGALLAGPVGTTVERAVS